MDSINELLMKPILFYFGPFPIYSYGLMIMLGFIAALCVVTPLCKRKGITFDSLVDITLIAILSGLIGGRIFFVLQFPENFDFGIFYFWDGVSLAGSILGAFAVIASLGNPKFFASIVIGFIGIIAIHNLSWLTSKTSFTILGKQLHIFDLGYLFIILVLGAINSTTAWAKFISLKRKILSIILLLIFIVITGRLFYCFQYTNLYSWQVFIFWQGGLIFHGGFICSVITVAYYCHKHKIAIIPIADILIIGVAIGLGLARIGCFLNGCCFGIECPHPSIFAVQYPPDSIPARSVNLRGINLQHIWKYYGTENSEYIDNCCDSSKNCSDQPLSHNSILSSFPQHLPKDIYKDIFRPIYATQLLSSLKGFLLFFFLFWFYPRRKYDGEVVLLFGIFYSLARFSIEIIRFDTPFLWGTGFTDGQLFSLAVFFISSGIWLHFKFLHKKFFNF